MQKHKCSACNEGWNDATRPCFNCEFPLEYRIPVGGTTPTPVRTQTQSAPTDLTEQQRFYQEVFGITLDTSNIRIPLGQQGFDWTLVIAEQPTLNGLLQKCKDCFEDVYCYTDDLDSVITHNDSRPQGNYAIHLRNRIEADEELKKLSANDLRQQNIQGITLKERLILELWYHWKTSDHLDVSNITLCSGSRDSGGCVPHVYWLGDKLRVRWYGPSDAPSVRRSRAVVS